MIHWYDPNVIAQSALLFGRLQLALIGLYGWESLLGLQQDWRFGKRLRQGTFWTRVPICVYFVSKYGTLLSLIGLNYANNATGRINCQAIFTTNELFGNIGIGGASTLLVLRCSAIWRHYPHVMYPLILLSLGQWAILLYSVTTVRSSRGPGGSCIITETNTSLLTALYAYTMALDFAVLIMTLLGVSRLGRPDSSLWRLLSRDSILYCALAFVSNVIAAVFVILRLNPVMEVMFTVPACVVSTIVACRSFARVYKLVHVKDQKGDQPPARFPVARHASHAHRPSLHNPDKGINVNFHEVHTLPFGEGMNGGIGTANSPVVRSQVIRSPPMPLLYPPPLARSSTPHSSGDISQTGWRADLEAQETQDSHFWRKSHHMSVSEGEESAMYFASVHTDDIASLDGSIALEEKPQRAVTKGKKKGLT
ncbi:hypothetical protein FRB94_002676 [Tulasnella sp. JGI-2019a]|nr:hypothetical protein FRB94_002676 [Tulasnella sp. JGI-2019a]